MTTRQTFLIGTTVLTAMAFSAVYAGEPETCPHAHPASCGGESKATDEIRCPNISGIYSDDSVRTKFEQIDCRFLTGLIGVKGSDGAFSYGFMRRIGSSN